MAQVRQLLTDEMSATLRVLVSGLNLFTQEGFKCEVMRQLKHLHYVYSRRTPGTRPNGSALALVP
jgi:hypothetical protein